jgi:Tfp pilus assembly protein PilW
MQSGLARLQENARFSLDTMAYSISMAGAKRDQATDPIPPINLAGTQNNITENVTAPYTFTTAAGTASDTLSVSYTAAVDCINSGTGAGGIATDIYEIRWDTKNDLDPTNDGPSLYCNNQPLVEGVENLQILYGDDTDNDGVANVYVSRNNITTTVSDTGALETHIPSIRIAILVNTVEGTGITSNNTFRLLNSPQLGPFNDDLIRRVFTRTIPVQNYVPAS